LVFPTVCLGLLLVGCGGPKKSSGTAPTAADTKLKGVWAGKLDTSGINREEPAAEAILSMAQQFEGQTDIEFPTEDRFILCAGGYYVEGSVTRSGTDVQLVPNKLNGMSLEKAKAAGITIQESLLRTMRLTLRNANLLWMPPGQVGERLVFERWTNDIASEMVDPPEDAYVGLWTVKQIEGMTAEHRNRGFDYVLKRTALHVQGDRKFQMRFTFRFLGEWTATASEITLNYPNGSFKLKKTPDGNLRLASPDGKVAIVLAKKR